MTTTAQEILKVVQEIGLPLNHRLAVWRHDDKQFQWLLVEVYPHPGCIVASITDEIIWEAISIREGKRLARDLHKEIGTVPPPLREKGPLDALRDTL
jgi:hypothetical protein